MANHGGKFKTDQILICEIDNHDAVNIEIAKKKGNKKEEIKKQSKIIILLTIIGCLKTLFLKVGT